MTARIVWWNCYNLFDDVNDPHTKDYVRPREEYLRDVREICEVLGALDPVADVLALGEVENLNVVNELCDEMRWNSNRDYRCPEYIESRDIRGIDVAVCERSDGTITIHDCEALWPNDSAAVRPILVAHTTCLGQPLTIAVIHSKSRRSGAVHAGDDIPGSRIRVSYGEALKKLAEECGEQHTSLVVVGDFNDHPDSFSLCQGAGAYIGREDEPRERRLYNLSWEAKADAPGTYVHDNEWAFLDQVLVSGSLLNGAYGLRVANRPRVVTRQPLLWHGKPNRWYSDHLPLSISLCKA